MHFRDIFKDAVKIRLRSDVEVGTSLSGGLDSSSIISTIKYIDLKEKASLGQKSYSAVFPGSKDDESGWVKLLSLRFNINSFFVKPDTDGLIKDLEQLILHQGEPFFSPNVYLQWEVMKLAKRNNTTVLLDGQGADEILAGYLNYFSVYWTGLMRSLKLFTLAKELGGYLFKRGFNRTAFINKSLLSRGLLTHILKTGHSFLRREFFSACIEDLPLAKSPKFDSLLKNTLYVSMSKTSLPYLLRYADRNSMAFSREIRLPFLDYRLVEFIFSIPDNFIIRQGQTKYILRKAMEGVVPREILNRHDKVGYAFPRSVWYEDNMQALMDNCVSQINGDNSFFIPNKLKAWWQLRLGGGKNYFQAREQWKVFNLLAWEKLIINQEGRL